MDEEAWSFDAGEGVGEWVLLLWMYGEDVVRFVSVAVVVELFELSGEACR